MDTEHFAQDVARRPENRRRGAEAACPLADGAWRSEGFYEDLAAALAPAPLVVAGPKPAAGRRVASAACWSSATFATPGPAVPTAWPSITWR